MIHQDRAAAVMAVLKAVTTEDAVTSSESARWRGAIHGRDSQIVAWLALATAIQFKGILEPDDHDFLLAMAETAILSLLPYQGELVNIETGEEPGKMPHEFMPPPEDGDGLSAYLSGLNYRRPWARRQDGSVLNYDSVDATPLWLCAAARYWFVTQDERFLEKVFSGAIDALAWLSTFADRNRDGLIDYGADWERRSMGGHFVQTWDESAVELVDDIADPKVHGVVTPAGPQAYAWLAYRLWAQILREEGPRFGLEERVSKNDADIYDHWAGCLRESFNLLFVQADARGISLASNLIGGPKRYQKLGNVRDVMVDALAFSLDPVIWEDRVPFPECILEDHLVRPLMHRMMQSDLFDPEAGLRVLSKADKHFGENYEGYHDEHWPHRNGLAVLGCQVFGHSEMARNFCTAVFIALDDVLEEDEEAVAPEMYVNPARKARLWRHKDPGHLDEWVSQGRQTWSAMAIYMMSQVLMSQKT